MTTKVNLAIQVLPLGIPKEDAYKIIDQAIAMISESSLTYKVCPFETVIEGPYDKVMQLVDNIQAACQQAGAEELLINMKLHRNFTKDLNITDKTGKYEDS